ncbi:MAG: sulfatase [Planctomycetota bacterium]
MIRFFVSTISIASAVLFFVAEPLPAQQSPKRNVLFIISDDLNNMLSCYGDPIIRTPNIDRLAAKSVRFERAYCAFPLCGPSRNSLLTGLYPNSTGIHANSQIFRQTIPNQLSMSQTFRQQGYFSARIGKLYHYNVPNSVGTNGHDDPASWELELNPVGVDRLQELNDTFSLTPGQFGGTLSWHASPKSDEHHTDAMMARDADWVLERCARDQRRPFFLAVGFFRPHTPYIAPKTPWFDMYREDAMPVISGIEEDQQDIPAPGLGSAKAEQAKMSDELRRKARHAYSAAISFMDAQVGFVLDSLKRHGLEDNTIIVFTSDHGYHMGEHGLWQKMSLFEESSRVPLLIAVPGVTSGSAAKAPVSHVDVFPTLAELCGVTPPANLQGQSLVPILQDPGATGRNWALTQVTRTGRSVRPESTTAASSDPSGNDAKQRKNQRKNKPETTETVPARFFGYSLRTPRWRYTEWDGGDKGRELYDHEADPSELTNLADASEHSSTVAELSKQLQAAVASTMPADGQIPQVGPGLWAPILVEPLSK